MTDDGPVFPSAPPERIDLPGDLALVRSDPSLTSAAVAAINESLDHLKPWMAWAVQPAADTTQREYFAASTERWDERRGFGFLIVEPASGSVVGGCGLEPRLGQNGLEIGYWVHADWIGRGVATAAARALTDAAFGIDGIERVRITCADDNVRSARVPEKLGYEPLGTWVPDAGECAGRSTQHWEVTRVAWQSASSS